MNTSTISGHFSQPGRQKAIKSLVSNRSTAKLSDKCGFGRKKVEISAKMLEERSKKISLPYQ
jgi:hypothetical protein